MVEVSQKLENSPNSLEEIVAYCQRVRQEYPAIETGRLNRRKHESILANHLSETFI